MEPVKFSIVTISFNHAEFVEDTIRSVLAQNYKNFEHIVIDGGSADNTLSILKRYPHLDWVSEPDRGISHALNKGLKKATGQILAWINSDDWYAPNIFGEIAPLVAQNHIIFGDAVETDRAGKEVRRITNHPRNLYDLQKYWIPNAWLAQPSVFFSKAALDAVRLPNGDYIDESFSYSMDCDLWLRLAEQFPFTCHVPKVFSHFRIYGENATGRTFASPQRELGRAFRGSANRITRNERPASIVIPVQSLLEPVGDTLKSVIEQTTQGFDIIVVDGTNTTEERNTIKETIMTIEESTTLTGFQLLKQHGKPLPKLLQAGMDAVRSPYFAVLRPGDIAPSDFITKLHTCFAHDVYGGAVLIDPKSALFDTILKPRAALLAPNQVLGLPTSFLPFATRQLVVKELGGFTSGEASEISFRTFLLKMMTKGWCIKLDHELNLSSYAAPPQPDPTTAMLLSLYVRAGVFYESYCALANDPFYPVRADTPYTVSYSPELAAEAKRFLDSADPEWALLSEHSTKERLLQSVQQFPLFAPGWYYLWLAEKRGGNAALAQDYLNRLRQLRPELPIS